MTIAADKKKNVSERYSLVRIKPARFYPAAQMVNVGGPNNLYSVDVSDLKSTILSVEQVGFAMNRTMSYPPANGSNDYYYDETTQVITFSAPSTPGDSNYFIVRYYLFFTTEHHRALPLDPQDASTALSDWLPRLMSEPSSKVSFSNITNGVFTIAESSIDLANGDGFFEKFLGQNDSFYNKEIRVWLALNDTLLPIFNGIVVSLKIDNQSLSLAIQDSFSKLKSTAGSILIPSPAHPDEEGRPFPLLVEYDSWAKYLQFTVSLGAVFFLSDGLKGYVSPFNSTILSTNNRTWYLARHSGALAVQSFGSLTRVATDVGAVKYYFKFSSFSNVRAGDTIEWVTSAVTHRALIIGIGTDAFTYLANTYDLVANGDGTHDGTLSLSSTINSLSAIAVCIFDRLKEKVASPLQNADYTVTYTSGATHITFVNNFEANYELDGATLGTVLDPGKHSVKYSLRQTGAVSHAAALKELLESAGMVCNAASFAAADVALIENVAFSIPNIDEDKYGSFLKYVQDIVVSTAGFLSINAAGEVEYSLLALPGAGDSKTEDLTLADSVSATLEYQDIITAITPYNPHSLSSTLTRFAFDKAFRLHGLVNEIKFRHVMAANNPLRIAEIRGIQGERSVSYSYETSTDDIDSVLGQDIALTSPRVLGGSGAQNLKITSIEKSADSTKIEASDLLGL